MGGTSKFLMLLKTPFPRICCSRSTFFSMDHHSRVSVACIYSTQKNRFYSNYRPHLGFPINASTQPPDDNSYAQTSSRPLRQNIEMKRGDWICPKCSFMNFAKNVKCLECEEARPKSQLTGGEWECPQCYFFNYGRNTVCVKCDCKHPGEVSYSNSSPSFGVGYGNGRNTNDANIMSKLAANEEKAERWFSKVSQMDSSSDLSSAIADEDFPDIMPLRKGGNRFVVSTRKTPLERRLANAQYRRSLGNDGIPEGNAFPQGGMMDPVKISDTSVSQNLDGILGRSSVVSETDNKLSVGWNSVDNNPFSSSAAPPAPQNWPSKGNNSSHVPFVPLPTDRFATPQNPKTEEDQVEYKYNSVAAKVDELTGYAASGIMDTSKSGGDESMLFGKPVNQTESKEKDHSLLSTPFKRRMALEHANTTNFIPFVPFPPDYFAKKDKQPEAGASVDKLSEEISTPNNMPRMQNVPENLEAARERWNSGFSSNGLKESKVGSVYGVTTENSYAKPEYSRAGNSQSWHNGYPQADTRQTSVYGVPTENSNLQPNGNSHADNSHADNSGSWKNGFQCRNPGQHQPAASPQNSRDNWNHNFTGKSLEGSAVKELDPLDMSEEAKAERWFRRVAQIKDISELSNIPDEDFPEIMPMRKGVNRFVVSKRKTPLERRLTSPQYRRNLPIVSSEPPIKTENDGN